jgi:hypothetical protein
MGIATSLFKEIDGIYWFPIIALIFFAVIFGVMTVHTLYMKKNHEQECSRMPLEDDDTLNSFQDL